MTSNDEGCQDLIGFERPRYFSGKLLTAVDFAAEQDYHRRKYSEHTRLLHGHGTVCGLEVRPTSPPSGQVKVEAGVALDCRGG